MPTVVQTKWPAPRNVTYIDNSGGTTTVSFAWDSSTGVNYDSYIITDSNGQAILNSSGEQQYFITAYLVIANGTTIVGITNYITGESSGIFDITFSSVSGATYTVAAVGVLPENTNEVILGASSSPATFSGSAFSYALPYQLMQGATNTITGYTLNPCTDISASKNSNGTITVSWTGPGTVPSGYSAPDYWVIIYDGANIKQGVRCGGNLSRNFTVTDPEYFAYDYAVAAVYIYTASGGAETTYCTDYTVKASKPLPPTPVLLSVDGGTPETATCTWSVTPNNNWGPISYYITATPLFPQNWPHTGSLVTQQCYVNNDLLSSQTLTDTIIDLVTLARYTFGVYATNGSGTNSYSNTTPLYVYDINTMVRNIKVVFRGTTPYVTWDLPIVPTFTTDYWIEYVALGEPIGTSGAGHRSYASFDQTSVLMQGVYNMIYDVPYTFGISQPDNIYFETNGNTVSNRVLVRPPKNVVASISGTSVNISWDPPSSTTGITGYTVVASCGITYTGILTTNTTINNLPSSITTTFTVFALNSYDDIIQSDPSNQITGSSTTTNTLVSTDAFLATITSPSVVKMKNCGIPSVPATTDVVCIAGSNNDIITLEDTPAAIYIPLKTGTIFLIIDGNKYSFEFSTLGIVNYKIYTNNVVVNSSWVAIGGFVTLGNETFIVGHTGSISLLSPSLISSSSGTMGVTATAGDTKAIITWTHPSVTVESYTINVSGGASPVQTLTNIASTQNSAEVTGLTNGVLYTVTVTAIVGEGTPYVVLTTVTPHEPAPCFLGTAPVLTPTGYHRMDSLEVGDLILTADRKEVAIQRISRTLVTPSPSTNPYIIPKGHLGATKQLLISPNHGVLVDGALVEARLLGLQQESIKEPFVYYNLELPEWSNMIVAGVEVESLAPKKRIIMSRATFNAELAKIKDKLTPASFRTLMKNCKFLEDGRVAANFIVGRPI